jgi:hypothetical protein
MSETTGLKALAAAVLRRDSRRDERRDNPSQACPTQDAAVRPREMSPEAARLQTIYEGLTADEKRRFAREVEEGDSGVLLILKLLQDMPAAGEA